MTREELINHLAFLDLEETPTVEVYILDQPVAVENGIDLNIYKGRMHEDLDQQIIDTFYPKIRSRLIRKQYDLVSYNPALTPDRTVNWFYPSDEVPFYGIVLEKLGELDDDDPIYYDNTILPYPDIWALWIRISIQGNDFYFLRKITPQKVLDTGGKLSLIFSQTVFRKLDQNVLTIDGNFDVFALNGTLIFENKTNFEKTLLYEEVKRQVANETLDDIQAIDIIENFDELRGFLVDDKHSINKLNKLKEKEYFRHKTFADYHSIIRDYNVPVTVDEANGKFNISNKAEAKQLIKVLNDDYLKSELTDLKYAANSKEETNANA